MLCQWIRVTGTKKIPIVPKEKESHQKEGRGTCYASLLSPVLSKSSKISTQDWTHAQNRNSKDTETKSNTH